jgi:hypothetical protein
MVRRLLVVSALLIVYGWGLHTLLLGGGILLDQHPYTQLRTSPADSIAHPPDGSRQAIIVAEQLMRPGASVAIVYRYRRQVDHYDRDYAYYWATWKMYPRPIAMADSMTDAVTGAPEYILDVGPALTSPVPAPQGYRIIQTHLFADNTTMTVFARA